MRLRPINDTLIVEPDAVLKHDGLIVLPEKNTEEKISPFATIVSWGDKCRYKYYVGQRIIMPTVNALDYERPFNFEFQGKQYRFIVESRLHAVIED